MKPIGEEIATTGDGRDITRPYLGPLLTAEDTILRTRPGGAHLEVYRQVRSEPQVQTVMTVRQRSLVAREWQVLAGGKRRIDIAAADSLRAQLNEMAWDDVTERMHWGVFYGYAVAEFMWGRDGREVVVDKVKVKNRARFRFDTEFRLRLLTVSRPFDGELMPERKFWTYCTGADHDDDPYGIGLAHWFYWLCFFKRGGLKAWLNRLDKHGSPTALGKYPAGATPQQKAELLAACQAMRSESGVIMPQGMEMMLLEAAKGAEDYASFVREMDQAIAKVGLGNVMLTEATAGQYRADVQAGAAADIVKADADLICESFNRGPARWLTEWNYPGAAPPRVFRVLEQGEDLKSRAERDESITRMGFRPTLAYIQDTYGGEWEPAAPASSLGGGTESVQQTALNGAQVRALREVIGQVEAGELPPARAAELLQSAFPAIAPATIRRLVGATPVAAQEAPGGVFAPGALPAPGAAPSDRFATALQRSATVPVSSFAAGDADTTPDLVDALVERLADQGAPVIEGWVGEVRRAVESADSYEEVLQRLAQLSYSLPLDDLGQMLAEASAQAGLGGRSDVQDRQ
jgi:phage gp29-like protein